MRLTSYSGDKYRTDVTKSEDTSWVVSCLEPIRPLVLDFAHPFPPSFFISNTSPLRGDIFWTYRAKCEEYYVRFSFEVRKIGFGIGEENVGEPLIALVITLIAVLPYACFYGTPG